MPTQLNLILSTGCLCPLDAFLTAYGLDAFVRSPKIAYSWFCFDMLPCSVLNGKTMTLVARYDINIASQ
jgi:hypothetical protein